MPQARAPTVAVAYSGGRDSTALLHATLAAARDGGVEVVALHVHHGLSVHADDWLAHCERQCAAWAAAGQPVEFDSRRVGGSGPARGESVEAWAREARYAALAEISQARGIDLVLLAHHRRDQAETVLLQALRGAGAAGLAAMPRVMRRRGITWARPWLDVEPGASTVTCERMRWRTSRTTAMPSRDGCATGCGWRSGRRSPPPFPTPRRRSPPWRRAPARRSSAPTNWR